MNGADIIAIIILATIVIAIVVYLLHWLYRHSSKDLSFVRTGFGGEKVVMGGGALVLPIVHDITEVSMNTLRIEVRRAGEKSLITRNRMRIEVIVEFFLRVIPTAEAVAAAARTLGNRTLDPESLRDLVQGRFVDAMGAVAAQMTMEEIHEHRADYIRAVRALVAESLTANGLELETASLTNLDQTDIKLFNPSNAFDAEGMTRLTEEIETRKKKRNDIEQDSIIAIRAKNLEAEKRALSIEKESEYARLEQEREIAVRRAQQRAEVAAEKAEREREIEEAQIRATEAVERARIRHELAINAENISREQELEKLEIQRKLSIEVEEQNRSVSVAVNEAENRTRLTEETEALKRKRNEIEQETLVAMQTKNLEAELRSLTIRKQGEFARLEQDRDIQQRRALQRAEVEFERLEREREVDEAERQDPRSRRARAHQGGSRDRSGEDPARSGDRAAGNPASATARNRGAGAVDRHRAEGARAGGGADRDGGRARSSRGSAGAGRLRAREGDRRAAQDDRADRCGTGGGAHQDQGYRRSGCGKAGGGGARRGREGLRGSLPPSLRSGSRRATHAQRGGEYALRRQPPQHAQPQIVRAIAADHPRKRQADGADRIHQDHAGRGFAGLQQRHPPGAAAATDRLPAPAGGTGAPAISRKAS